MDYSEKLKIIRKTLKISQLKLAELLCVNYATISRIERKIFNPSHDLIKKIDNLCITYKILLEDESLFLGKNVISSGVLEDISVIISNSYADANKTVNYLLVKRNWFIGKRINEEIKSSNKKDYGKHLIDKLSTYLTDKFGLGFDQRNLYSYINFYKKFPNILNAVSSKPFLSWTHYRILLQVEDEKEREWYASECNKELWSSRTLQRNVSSQYYQRIVANNKICKNDNATSKEKSLSRDDYIKDPMILEFLRINENNIFVESDLEKSIITHLQKFLMELGKGYAFVSRQQRIHTEKQDYFIDLVFYNYIMKCFVLIDLKMGKITYQDVGQMDMYIKMYDEFKRSETDNPTLGIVLTSDTDEDIAKYSVLHGNEQLFASKYKLYLPSDEELKEEIERQKQFYELKQK